MKSLVFLFFIALSCICCNSPSPQKAATNEAPKKYYYHNLLLKWKDSLDFDKRAKTFSLFYGLPPKIEGFEEVQIIDLAPSESTFNTLIIQKYTSKEAEEAYQVHPDHEAIKALGPDILAGFAEFDYWGN